MPAGRERPALSGLPVGDGQLSPPRREQPTPAPHRCWRLRSLFATWPVAADDGVVSPPSMVSFSSTRPTNRSSASRWVDTASRTSVVRPRDKQSPHFLVWDSLHFLAYAPRWGRGNRGSWAGQLRSRKISCSAARPRDQLHQGLGDARAFNRSPRPTLARVSSRAWCHSEGRG
jgi:hypothetical protein